MSLRIQNDPAVNGSSPEVGRAGQSSAITSGSGKARTQSTGEGGDHVEVSSATETISAGVSTQNLQHAAKVANLSALYASGKYAVDSAQVSRAIVNNAVTASPAGKA